MATTSGVATFGLLPPIFPGSIEPEKEGILRQCIHAMYTMYADNVYNVYRQCIQCIKTEGILRQCMCLLQYAIIIPIFLPYSGLWCVIVNLI